MNLPEETAVFAQQKADELEGADDIAEAIYQDAVELEYGMSKAFEDETWMRYPHETAEDSQANCYETALYVYAVADALDLDPRFLEIEEQRDEDLAHGFVDVEDPETGERVAVDPRMNLFGPVAWYSDSKVTLHDNPIGSRTEKKYKVIDRLSEPRMILRVEDLRQSSVNILKDGQKFNVSFDTRRGETHDKINFNEDDNYLERLVTFYTNKGFWNHSIKVQRFFAGNGDLVETKEVFSDVSGAGYSSTNGENVLAEHVDGEIQLADELPVSVRENIAAILRYEEAKGDDDLLYSSDRVEQYIDEYYDSLAQLVDGDLTAFNRITLQEELALLEEAADDNPRQDFLERIDWQIFLEEHPDREIPSDEEIQQLLPDYLERHEEVLEDVRGQPYNPVIENITDDVSRTLQEEDEGLTREEALRTIRNGGIGAVYDFMAGSLADGVPDGLPAEGRQELEEDPVLGNPEYYFSTAFYNPELRESYETLLQQRVEDMGGEEKGELQGFVEAAVPVQESIALDVPPSFADIEFSRDFRRDDNVLKLGNTIHTNRLSPYDSHADIHVSFTDLGQVDGIRIRMYDSLPHTSEEYVLFDRELDSLDDLDEVEADMVAEEVVERFDDLQDEGYLTAPDPTAEERYTEQIASDTAVFAGFSSIWEEVPRTYPSLFDKEELDAFYEQWREENSWLLDTDHISRQRREQLQRRNEEDLVDNGDMFYERAEIDMLWNLVFKDAFDTLQERVEQVYGSGKEIMEAYVTAKHLTFLELNIGQDSWESVDSYTEVVKEGMVETIPQADRVERFAEEHGFDVIGEINEVLDANRAWDRKAYEIAERLDELRERYHRIDDEWEREAVFDSLRSFEARLQDRWRYQDWQEEHDLDLEAEISAAREEVADMELVTNLTGELDETVTEQLLEEAGVAA